MLSKKSRQSLGQGKLGFYVRLYCNLLTRNLLLCDVFDAANIKLAIDKQVWQSCHFTIGVLMSE